MMIEGKTCPVMSRVWIDGEITECTRDCAAFVESKHWERDDDQVDIPLVIQRCLMMPGVQDGR